MASRDEYAMWCMKLIEGEDYMINDIMAALYEDGYVDEDQEWVYEEDE